MFTTQTAQVQLGYWMLIAVAIFLGAVLGFRKLARKSFGWTTLGHVYLSLLLIFYFASAMVQQRVLTKLSDLIGYEATAFAGALVTLAVEAGWILAASLIWFMLFKFMNWVCWRYFPRPARSGDRAPQV